MLSMICTFWFVIIQLKVLTIEAHQLHYINLTSNKILKPFRMSVEFLSYRFTFRNTRGFGEKKSLVWSLHQFTMCAQKSNHMVNNDPENRITFS